MEDGIQRPLHWLVGNDANFSQVEERLKDPNERDFSGLTLLHTAAKSLDYNLKTMKLLIDRGADLESVTPAGQTSLHLAVCQEQRDSIIALTTAGASINAKDNLGRTALHLAVLQKPARTGNPYLNTHCDMWIVDWLLGRPEIDVNAVDQEGETPLIWAVRGRHWRAVVPFLKKGANPTIPNKHGRTPLHEALSARIPINHIVENLLLYGAGIYGADCSGITPVDILLQRIHDNGTFELAAFFVWEVALRYHIYDSLEEKLEKVPLLSKHFYECCKEVRLMKRLVIYDNVTLHDVALDCFQRCTVFNPVQEVYVPVVECLLSGRFDKYSQYILSRLSVSYLLCVLEITAPKHLVPTNATNLTIFAAIRRAYDHSIELRNRLRRFIKAKIKKI